MAGLIFFVQESVRSYNSLNQIVQKERVVVRFANHIDAVIAMRATINAHVRDTYHVPDLTALLDGGDEEETPQAEKMDMLIKYLTGQRSELVDLVPGIKETFNTHGETKIVLSLHKQLVASGSYTRGWYNYPLRAWRAEFKIKLVFESELESDSESEAEDAEPSAHSQSTTELTDTE